MNDDLKGIERRPIQYFYSDGLIEIAIGVIFLLLGGIIFGQSVLPENSPVGHILTILFVLILISSGFLVGRILRFLKNRLTYPRTGYVEYKKKAPNPRRKRAAAIVGAVVGAALSGLVAAAPSVRLWLPALNGLLLGLAVYLFWRRAGVSRFLILAGASALVGIGIALAGVADIKGIGLYYVLFGAAVIISGLVTFAGYWRRSRTAMEPPDER